MCSVEELIDHNFTLQTPESRETILSALSAKEILRQATRGLDYLHQNNFVHRNIKPNNFLIKHINDAYGKDGNIIKRQYAIKITDFRLTRKWEPGIQKELSGSAASEGWEAPESGKIGAELKNTLDVFLLGCFYNYVLTGIKTGQPKHPFGEKGERISNISNGTTDPNFKFQPETGNIEEIAVAELIKQMINFDEKSRPHSLKDILKNTYFQPSGFYDIYGYKKPGLCVIFNQEEFDPKNNPKVSFLFSLLLLIFLFFLSYIIGNSQ